ncbi:hypothetical protein BJ508DRAFT_307942 [Ascobolus immersus RN42]|uniref:Uncharacterized protein n=1 Tax=Ascobolus immersus RN42 TaxID=1160509 RepID=A0A3N4I573_ASCIM|nr:hypothetical protein BJ508DRAFT_307942 [Ascobolus immersus RN42]
MQTRFWRSLHAYLATLLLFATLTKPSPVNNPPTESKPEGSEIPLEIFSEVEYDTPTLPIAPVPVYGESDAEQHIRYPNISVSQIQSTPGSGSKEDIRLIPTYAFPMVSACLKRKRSQGAGANLPILITDTFYHDYITAVPKAIAKLYHIWLLGAQSNPKVDINQMQFAIRPHPDPSTGFQEMFFFCNLDRDEPRAPNIEQYLSADGIGGGDPGGLERMCGSRQAGYFHEHWPIYAIEPLQALSTLILFVNHFFATASPTASSLHSTHEVTISSIGRSRTKNVLHIKQATTGAQPPAEPHLERLNSTNTIIITTTADPKHLERRAQEALTICITPPNLDLTNPLISDVVYHHYLEWDESTAEKRQRERPFDEIIMADPGPDDEHAPERGRTAFYFCNLDKSEPRVPLIREYMEVDGILERQCGSRRPGVGFVGRLGKDGRVEFLKAYARAWDPQTYNRAL